MPALVFFGLWFFIIRRLADKQGMGGFLSIGKSGMGGHDEKEQTLNQLLVEMDGFDSSVGLIILAATNRPEILDPALLRAGRFDRQVLVDRQGRIAILKVHGRHVTLDPALQLEQVAALTPGFSGADLANLVNEAALVATRRKASHVTLEDFNAAVERIVAGLEKKNRLLSRRRAAPRRLSTRSAGGTGTPGPGANSSLQGDKDPEQHVEQQPGAAAEEQHGDYQPAHP